jgi:hypothetical protein
MRVSLRGLQGLGDTCPSMEQLNGIVDPNDPCQQMASTAVISTSVAPAGISESQLCLPVGSAGPLAPGEVYCATGTASLTPTAGTAPSAAAASISTEALVAIGGGLLFLLLLIGMKK